MKKSSMQLMYVHDFLTEIMLYKQNSWLISLRRIIILFSVLSDSLPYFQKSRKLMFNLVWTPISRLQTQGVFKEIVS